MFSVCLISLCCSGIAVADDLLTCTNASSDAAHAACTRALNGRLNRDQRVMAYNARGILNKRRGDFDRAIADYSAALALNPRDKYALYNRGIIYHDQGDLVRSRADYDAAIRSDPKFALAYNNRAAISVDEDALDAAMADYNTAIRLDPRYVAAYTSRGVAYRRKGDFDRAIADHTTAIRLDRSHTEAWDNRGFAYAEKGDYDRAIADYTEAIRLSPRYTLPLANRAFAYEKKRKFAEALADFRAVITLNPSQQQAFEQDIRRVEGKIKGATADAAPPTGKPIARLDQNSPRAGLPVRVALVIGNGAYQKAAALPNPPNDAADVADALRKLGFDVLEARDLDRRGMDAKVREFSRKTETADLALFFYAGHGMQVTGTNYLVPTDANLRPESNLDVEAFDLNVVLRHMANGPRANLIFLDACRNNPLAIALSRSLGIRAAAVGPGLASIQSGVGTMIVYATQPDNVALDGDGRNSPFTSALLTHLFDKGVDIGVMLRRVRADVIQATQTRQVPWDNSSLVDDVVLAR